MAVSNMLCGGNGLYKRYTLRYSLDAEMRLGFSCIALYPFGTHFWVHHQGHDDCGPLRRALSDRQLSVPLLLPPPFQYSLCAKKGTLQREMTFAYYRQCLDVAAQLGAKNLCVDARGGCLDDGGPRLHALLVEGLHTLCDLSGDFGVGIVLQTVPSDEAGACNTLDQLELVMAEVADDRLGALLDTYAINRARESVSQWFLRLNGRISHVRLADGRNDGYRIWGEGCYPLDAYLEQLKSAQYLGPIGLHFDAERYWNAPAQASEQNLRALQQMASDHAAGKESAWP